jgi:hypothetical protein
VVLAAGAVVLDFGYAAGDHDDVASDAALRAAMRARLIGASVACRDCGRMAAGHLDVPDLGGGSVAAVHDCEELFLPLVAQTVGPVGKTVVMTKGGSSMGEGDSGTTAEMVRA